MLSSVSHFFQKNTVLLTAAILFFCALPARAENEPENLYARAAALMDADSGRILFEKNGEERLPMASTTKIMTLLITLENADLDSFVEVSAYAASMPDVQLGICEGERYRLLDLCYSLMLESHNDTAVAIAEHVGGSVEGFAALMNQKARDLGCYDTYFITPNGLDAADETGVHSTTAEDLARIMRCCMENETFLAITQTSSWSFGDLDGTRSFTVNNKNAFLNMMEGALTGKTGFTNDAGYCYVGALERDGKRLIAVVLACGWPNNKNWKWSDTTKLMSYGLQEFESVTVGVDSLTPEPLPVTNGQSAEVSLGVEISPESLLLCAEDRFSVEILLPDSLEAPVYEGEIVGSVVYYINGEILDLFPITAAEDVPAIDFRWRLEQVARQWAL